MPASTRVRVFPPGGRSPGVDGPGGGLCWQNRDRTQDDLHRTGTDSAPALPPPPAFLSGHPAPAPTLAQANLRVGGTPLRITREESSVLPKSQAAAEHILSSLLRVGGHWSSLLVLPSRSPVWKCSPQSVLSGPGTVRLDTAPVPE